jgi:hypothetical protein
MKNTRRVRERVASQAELAEDRRRCLAAREQHRPLAPLPPTPAPSEGNLVKCLVVFAAWRKCCVCSRPVLYVDARCRTDADVECPTCQGVRENLAKRLKPSLPMRAALHLHALFWTGNDNGVRA